MQCKICKDVGWVCEEHQNNPMEHRLLYVKGKGFNKECSGAGMPCKCNKENPPWNYHNPK